MCPKKRIDFGGEISKMHPVIMREIAKRNMMGVLKSGVTFPQIAILDFLNERGPSKMGDLANMLNMTMSAVTGIVDKMIKLKLVKRDRSSKDRRIVRIVLLKKACGMVKLMDKERRELVNDLFSVFTSSEKREYLKLVKKMYNNLAGEN
ncbi:MAG: MarR family transcriptional regulator [Candidatus Omnitrophota bacterium]|nr:MarR family transcriptional regulator [Candidatus Omnitrophota bacterium]MBU1894748.1 MarR family transcriptional regulator [Candidatus Omnitrophota bacterium]